jgi:twitching motility two-component system response regulator PilH
MTRPSSIGALAPRGKLALVVDDASVDRDRIADILHRAGWQVEVAGSGREALEVALARPPDIIFLDIVMPGMDGFEACRRLAEDPRTRAIPIVFVSTKSQRADHLWARMQGGRELIAKPFTAEQLLGALRHAGS